MMQALRKINGKWTEERPDDLVKWLNRNDGEEAVVKGRNIVYCATPALMEAYQAKGKTAAMFIDLSRELFEDEPPFDPATSANWCERQRLICSDKECCHNCGEGRA